MKFFSDLAEILGDVSGSDWATLAIVVFTLITGFFGYLTSREVRRKDGAPLKTALKVIQTADNVNKRGAKSLDKLSDTFEHHLVELNAASRANTATLEQISSRIAQLQHAMGEKAVDHDS